VTPEDLSRIEDELGVELPEGYRQLMLDYPFPDGKGNTNENLWDDADAVIEKTALYRSPRVHNVWPSHFVYIGDDQAGCPYAIDVREDAGPVVHTDRGDLEKPLETWPSIDAWIKDYVETLQAEGLDPLVATPPETAKDKLAHWACMLCCLAAILVAALVIGLICSYFMRN